MNCRFVREHRDEYLDALLAKPEHDLVDTHLGSCSNCRQTVARERALRKALREFPIPNPDPDLFDRVFESAKHRALGQRRQMGLAAACGSLVFGVLYWIIIGSVPSEITDQPSLAQIEQITMTVDRVRTVTLAFDSPHALGQAELTLKLPPNIGLMGYHGEREIAWQADFQKGNNLLSLPLLPFSQGTGELETRIEHGNDTKTFRLRVTVMRPQASRTASINSV